MNLSESMAGRKRDVDCSDTLCQGETDQTVAVVERRRHTRNGGGQCQCPYSCVSERAAPNLGNSFGNGDALQLRTILKCRCADFGHAHGNIYRLQAAATLESAGAYRGEAFGEGYRRDAFAVDESVAADAWHPVGDDEVSNLGVLVAIDMLGVMAWGGKDAFEGGEATKHHLILGSGSFIPGFEDQVIGHKAGDKFDVNVKFPADYHAENLAGKDARFEVLVHEVRKHILPEMNDDLAKQVGQESVEKLKEHIREIISNQYVEVAQQEMRNELLDVLADKVKMPLPEILVEQELEMAKREHDHHNAEHGHDHKWDEKKERKDAERRVKLGLILAEWGSQNKVEVTRDDLQQAIWAEASRYPDPKQIFEFYNKNQNALTMLRGMLFERKALDALLTHVKTKEKTVPADELFKQASVR